MHDDQPSVGVTSKVSYLYAQPKLIITINSSAIFPQELALQFFSLSDAGKKATKAKVTTITNVHTIHTKTPILDYFQKSRVS